VQSIEVALSLWGPAELAVRLQLFLCSERRMLNLRRGLFRLWLVSTVLWVAYFGWVGVTSYFEAASSTKSARYYRERLWNSGLEEASRGFFAFAPTKAEEQRQQRVSRVAELTGLPPGLVNTHIDELQAEIESRYRERSQACPSSSPHCAWDSFRASLPSEMKRSPILAQWLAAHPYNTGDGQLTLETVVREAKEAREMLRMYDRAESEARSTVAWAVQYGFMVPAATLLLFPFCSYVMVPVGTYVWRGFRPESSSQAHLRVETTRAVNEQRTSATALHARPAPPQTSEACRIVTPSLPAAHLRGQKIGWTRNLLWIGGVIAFVVVNLMLGRGERMLATLVSTLVQVGGSIGFIWLIRVAIRRSQDVQGQL
jgi:hypothetical protein